MLIPIVFFSVSVSLLILRYFGMKSVLNKIAASRGDLEKSDVRTPPLITYFGIGTRFYGTFCRTTPSDDLILSLHLDPHDDIYVTYLCFCVFFIPIIPLRAYKVIDINSSRGVDINTSGMATLQEYHIIGTMTYNKIEALALCLSSLAWFGIVCAIVMALIRIL